jgi:hypothetical protein
MSNSPTLRLYECSGLVVASEIALSAPESKLSDPAKADVFVSLGADVVLPVERPSEQVVAELVVDGYVHYTFCRVGDGYVARMPLIADFVIDGDLKHVTCCPAVAGRSELIPIILPGTVVAFLLAMAGFSVLHGSAVEVDGGALAFVGPSGQGKSTLAALFCATGAPLVTDDVLPLKFVTGRGSPQVYCVRSGTEIRLREKAASLAQRFDAATAVRMTADDRHGVTPVPSAIERIPLRAVILPRPDRENSQVKAYPLEAGVASLWLNRVQRIEGWRERAQLRQQFTDVGHIVAAVPIFEVSVPWGPPFAEDLPEQILEAIQWSVQGAGSLA